MYTPTQARAGFTITEILVTLAIMMMMAVVIFAGFVGYSQLQVHTQLTAEVETLLHTAKQQSQTLTENDAYGVSFTATSAVLFAQSATSSPLRTLALPAGYILTPSLAGAATTVVFARRTGVPNVTGTLSLYDTRRQATTTVTILPSGLVE